MSASENRKTPNQALERTADRRVNSHMIDSTFNFVEKRSRQRSLSSVSLEMRSLIVIVFIAFIAAARACAQPQTEPSMALDPAAGPIINIEDVDRFYKVYDAADGHPTAEQLQHDYLDPGSDGLHEFAKLRKISGTTIAEALARHPEIYSSGKGCLAVLPRARQRLQIAFRKLSQLYPEAKFPPVTIAVGRGKPVGVADASGVMIGLEALCAVNYFNPNVEDRFVHVIAHEYTHVQQALLAPTLYNDQKPTVLEESLIEGAAEFTAELTSGDVSNSALIAMTKGREKEIESAFAADEDKTDLSQWLYNGTLEKSGDLGYWVGYRIVSAYYQHAADKRRAFREILEMTDPKAFLAKSGWYPGIQLQKQPMRSPNAYRPASESSHPKA
jgi:Predicted Zn-dependent protease (DUF2268)